MRTATTATTATSATCKRLPQVPLGLSLAARSALIPSALFCSVYQGRLRSQQLLCHLPRSPFSSCQSLCRPLFGLGTVCPIFSSP